MDLVRWRPFDMDKWFDDMVPASFVGHGGFTPVMDVYQTEEAVVVKTPLAGVDPEKVDISIENDVLTVEGSTEQKSEVDDKGYCRKEIRTASFHRAVTLPAAVNGENAEAEFENGMLTITVPKEEKAKPKAVKIEIKQ